MEYSQKTSATLSTSTDNKPESWNQKNIIGVFNNKLLVLLLSTKEPTVNACRELENTPKDSVHEVENYNYKFFPR